VQLSFLYIAVQMYSTPSYIVNCTDTQFTIPLLCAVQLQYR
jgi:hypothetical protein